MSDLKALYHRLGLKNATTYVQSGNVVFAAGGLKPKELEKKIEEAILKAYGFEVPVIALPLAALKKIVDGNPFVKDAGKDETYMHVTFMATAPAGFPTEQITKVAQAGEEIVFSGAAVYLYCPNGYGRTKLSNTFLESKLKVRATTRNWKTVMALLEMAEAL